MAGGQIHYYFPITNISKSFITINPTFANPAGMILVWNAKTKTGKGYALTFDFNILKGYALEKSPKVAVVLAGLEHIENPDQYITTAASFDLDEETYNKITRADSNPYQVVGLMD